MKKKKTTKELGAYSPQYMLVPSYVHLDGHLVVDTLYDPTQSFQLLPYPIENSGIKYEYFLQIILRYFRSMENNALSSHIHDEFHSLNS